MPKPPPRPPARAIPKVPKYGAAPVPVAAPPNLHWMWLGAAVLIVPLVVFLQQYTLSLRSVTLEHAPKAKMESEEVSEPGIAPLTISAKLAVQVFNEDREAYDPDGVRRSFVELDSLAVSRPERLRVAIVAGEILGKDAAVDRLKKLREEAAPNQDLAREIDWMLRLYQEGPEKLPDEARASLIDRHGWFARLALSHGKPMWDLSRRELVRPPGGGVLAVVLVLLLLALGGLVGGIIALGVLGRRWRAGQLESHIDEQVSLEVGAEKVHLEFFTLFVGGFLFLLGMHLVMFGMAAEGTLGALVFMEVLTWGLAAVLLWPLIRRVPWADFARDIGLHRGQGFGREALCGVVGYLAGLPLMILVAKVIGTVQMMVGETESDADPHGYPLFEPPAENSWALVWVGILSAVLWAPVLEEVVVRGALFRWLYARVPWWGTVLITAAVFGMVHPYTTAGLVQVGSMGVMLAMLRLWRGSLIAPMVAHAIHNGFISVMQVVYIAALS